MINVVSYTKDYLKELNRELQIWGCLYIAKKRQSKNLWPFGKAYSGGNEGQWALPDTSVSFPSGTYTLSADISGGDAYIIFNYKYSDNIDHITSLSNFVTLNFTNEVVKIALYVPSNVTVDNIMLEKGSNVSSYEEYGVLIKDYNVLYDENNLFDKTNVTNHFLRTNGTTYYNANYKCSDFINVDSNIITFSGIDAFNNGNIVYYDSTKTNVLGYAEYVGNRTYVLDSQTKYIRFCINNASLDTTHLQYGVAKKTSNLLNINNVVVESTDENKYLNRINDVIVGTNVNETSAAVLGKVRLFDVSDYRGEGLNFSFTQDGNGWVELRYGDENGPINDAQHLIDNSIVSYKWFNVPSSLTSSQYIWAIFKTNQKKMSFYDIQIQSGTPMNRPIYEKFNATYFALDDNTKCQILSLNIYEKADIYYSSVPGNSLTIELNNEQGYFTDYYQNNILDYLNEDCYIDLFLWSSGGDVFKIARMNFDKVEYSDYEKARLTFKSCLAFTDNADIKDKNLDFNNSWGMDFPEFRNYLSNNYNITALNNHKSYIDGNYIFFNENFKYKNLRDILLNCATNRMGSVDAGVMLMNDKNNNLCFKSFTNIYCETITSSMELDKPKNKKEDSYKGVKYNYYDDDPKVYEATTDTYTQTITRTLKSEKETLILTDDYCKLDDITIGDITSTSNVEVTLTQNLYNIKKILILTIKGNIGDEYTIQISKDNIYKYRGTNYVTYNIGNTSDTTKIISVESTSVLGASFYIFLFIKKPVKSFVEARIMGLPYLEIGDTVQIELDNKYVKIVITEIETNYGEGVLQTIRGYELDWTHFVTTPAAYTDLNGWDGLVPSDTLYPSNTLYPH